MPIELRIQTGALAGVTQSFDKSIIAVGRHPMSDLRFDAQRDLDVSTRHGEIRGRDGTYSIHDLQSTNGTFVNGVRVPSGGSLPLSDRDVIAFGAGGPTVLVRIAAEAVAPPSTLPKMETSGGGARRPRTDERVAVAVREKTRSLRNAMIASILVLGGIAGGLFYKGVQDAAARDARIRELVAANDQVNHELQARLQGDTALTNSLRRHNDSLTQAVRDARNAAQAAAASAELRRSHDAQRRFADMGLPEVRDANDAAVALIVSAIGSQEFESTGFSVSASGLLVTNRHVVIDSAGARASKIMVKFANTRVWHHARLLKLSDNTQTDLALIQVEGGGNFPAVQSIAYSVDVPVGASIATIGYPLGSELPMDDTGGQAAAKTSLTIGTVSKSVPGLLQIDAFASYGSSGSPVLDAHGHVIGVVWGGAKGADGRIVFAVPAEEIRKLLK